ncbi:MAG: thiamine pyrophosphate-binding protein [Clostridiales bacterium]|nr:thiamine pyrophosphate-binding protein [Clostridiales bacterium]
MNVRVADYIADFLSDNGITDVFTVTGGGAMHLNDALGHHPKLRSTYNHHEQACAIAAEGYARYSGKIAAICVTSGPGGTNAITGVMGGWLDSIPMFVLSGQVKFTTTIRSTHVPLRQLGDQEFNIVDTVKTMTKYAVMIENPYDIAYVLEKALFLATHGRPGPVWIDVPLNVQGATIDTEKLHHYNSAEDAGEIPPPVGQSTIDEIIIRINNAKRPVIFAGEGIRFSGACEGFLSLVKKLGVPVVTAWNAHDLIADENPCSAGRPGTVGTRGGNFVAQYSDLLLVLGCRLNIRQISYNWENFAKDAYKIMVDIDSAELMKPTLKIDLPIHADVKDVINKLNESNAPLSDHSKWTDWARQINLRYPACLEEMKKEESPINPYAFVDSLFRNLDEDDAVVCSNGSACVIGFQAGIIKKRTRLFTNSGCAAMGYGLPAALGVSVRRGKKRTVCIEGDGSLQMNIQELQTVFQYKLNLKIVVLNNAGYHSIRQTQRNLFSNHCEVGVGPESGDLSFPELERIAYAYQIPFVKVEKYSEADKKIREALSIEGPVIVEAVLNPKQFFSPKLSSKKLPDGSMVSPSLEDMYPFLPEEEMRAVKAEAFSL